MNFKGCFGYNPETNPLRGLNKAEREQFVFEYMQIWCSEEGFDDHSIMFEAGDAELLADTLVSAGAINSETCYKACKPIERIIEG